MGATTKTTGIRPRIRRLWWSVFPAPRQPLTGLATVPLVVFLLAFAAVCVSLELASVVTFTRWWPFGLLVLAPWLWWMWVAGQNGLSKVRSLIALGMRLVIFALLVVTLAEPRAVRTDDRLAVMYAIDVSGSVAPEAIDAARQFVGRVGAGAKPERDSSGLLYFGRHAAVQLPPKADVSAEQLQSIDVPIKVDGSNLEQALSLSAAVLPESQNGRIVLITDGVSTEGNLSAVLSELKSRKIAVDVLPVSYSYDEEVWLERLDLPRIVKERQTYDAAVVVSSLKAGRGRLVLMENDQKVMDAEVEYGAGKSRFRVPIHLRGPGYYEYSAQLEPLTKDHIRQNNVAVGSVFLEGQGKILLVTEPGGDDRDWQAFASTLTQANFVSEQITATEFPEDPLSLRVYDAIVFLNVARDAFDPEALQVVHDAVYHQGVGFLMVGGPRSFGPGSWAKSPVEQVLPVELDLTQRKVLLNGALMLVLDHSGSMGSPVPGAAGNKQQLANSAAAAAIGMLHARDWLGVVSFDSNPTWVVPFGVNDNAPAAMRDVRAIGTGGGTNMYPALEEALKALEGLKEGEAAVRHIVLLTDGQSSGGNLREFIDGCQKARISVSTIGVGAPGEIDAELLALIARETAGRSYTINDAQALPRILIHEAVTLRKSAFREDVFTPGPATFSPILKGIEAIPPLHGLVVTVPKERAEQVLMAPSDEEDGPLDPVLAVHSYGVGRAAAFTSDLSPRWGKDWLQWDHFQPFLQQLFLDLSRPRRDSHLKVESFAAGTEGVIHVEDHGPEEAFLDLRAQIQDPARKSQTIRLLQVGARRYEGRFPLSGEGRYLMTVFGEQDRVTDGLVIPFSQEYLRFTDNPRVLQQIVETTGGRLLTGTEEAAELYTIARQPTSSSRPIVDLMLMILALLIPLDVGLRRIQIDWSVLRGRFSRQAAERSATLSTLLQNRESVTTSLQERSLPTPRKAPSTPALRPAGLRPTEPVVEASPAAAGQPKVEATSTTSRLLAAMKQHRSGSGDPPPK